MFLIVEGVDGAGKTLASKILKERLQLHAPHSEIVNCRAPDGPIRDVLLNRPEGTIIDHQTELLLFATCHRWLLINKVLPALDRGATVILDRFTDSTISYQGGGRELGVDVVHNLCNNWCSISSGRASCPITASTSKRPRTSGKPVWPNEATSTTWTSKAWSSVAATST